MFVGRFLFSFVNLFICLFVHIHTFIYSIIHSFIHPCMHQQSPTNQFKTIQIWLFEMSGLLKVTYSHQFDRRLGLAQETTRRRTVFSPFHWINNIESNTVAIAVINCFIHLNWSKTDKLFFMDGLTWCVSGRACGKRILCVMIILTQSIRCIQYLVSSLHLSHSFKFICIVECALSILIFSI